MSLEVLLAKINEKENDLRKTLQAEYDVLFEKIKIEFEAEIAVYKESEEANFLAKIEFLKQKEETNLDLEKRKAMLNLKREILAEVYADFVEQLQNVSDADYGKWLEKELAKLTISESGVLSIGFKNVPIKVNCKVVFDENLGFGFKYQEGSTIFNNGLDSILSYLTTEKELDLARILFV